MSVELERANKIVENTAIELMGLGYCKRVDEHEMPDFPAKAELESDFSWWLYTYTGFEAYYAQQYTAWKTISELLECRHKIEFDRAVVASFQAAEEAGKKPVISRLEISARVLTSDLNRAIIISQSKMHSFRTKMEQARSFKESISRLFTMMEKREPKEDERPNKWTEFQNQM